MHPIRSNGRSLIREWKEKTKFLRTIRFLKVFFFLSFVLNGRISFSFFFFFLFFLDHVRCSRKKEIEEGKFKNALGY